MASSVFKILEHSVPCQHIREYPGGVKKGNTSLSLAIKEYIPLNNLNAVEGSITIIATHAIGFPKEIYEPLWEDLVRQNSVKIRGIWFADCSHHGASGVMNELALGDDPHWFDHSRDLLNMVNIFRDRIVQPVFGVGHSMGTAQLVRLSIIHPSLFQGLVLYEPVIQNCLPPGFNAALPSTFRKDVWPSKEKAAASVTRSPFFQSFDPRATAKYLEFGFRKIPTALYPGATDKVLEGSVTLATTKAQEAWSYCRATFDPLPTNSFDPFEQLISPELDTTQEESQLVFVRPESLHAFLDLPHLRPSVLWVYGEDSPLNSQELQNEKLKLTGIGRGGSGGAKAGRVKQAVIKDAAHLAPFEKVTESANVISAWLKQEMQRYQEVLHFYETHDRKVSRPQGHGLALSKEWIKMVQEPIDVRRSTREKL
ncbi:Alpha/beta hydrolase family-domain-containing protein [Tricladium varicosporioides]|nr:Alpha/beta hydrolase family-domain-containing protein [Hymenoscyphus varicosporioides]